MATHYNRRSAPVVLRAAPAKPQTAKTPPPQTAKTTPPKVAPQPPKPVPAKPTIIVKQLPPVVKPAQPVVKQPPPIVKPAHPIVKQPPPIAKPAQPKQMELPQAEGDSGMLAEIGGFFKSTAKLIVPKKKKPPAPAVTNASSQIIVVGRKLERPSQVLSRDPRDLAALEAMPGYEKGGPVSAELTPFRIAGPAWRAPTTYYYMNGRIVTGDKVNERLVEKGAYIFYRK